MKSLFSILAFVTISIYIQVETAKSWHGHVFEWDKAGYHVYLPAVFIYQDLDNLEFYKEIDEYYRPTGDNKYFCMYEHPDGKRTNRYSVGVSVHELPFFLGAQFITLNFTDAKPDGYSVPYQWGAVISNLFWTVIGLLAIRTFLRRRFTDLIVAITLLIVALGTNLFHYNTFSPGMAHAYSFCQYALLLLATDNLYRTGKTRYFYLIALIMGVITITRVPNLLVGLIPLLWAVHNKTTFRNRLSFLKSNLLHIAVAIPVFVSVCLLQFGYLKYTSGQWLFDTYPGEGFVWSKPKLLEGLFGFRKGWFIYTPLALLAVAGIYSLKYRFKEYIPMLVIFMTLNIYVIFCWWNWWYGGGFGARPLIESYALLALPLAAIIEQTGKRNNIVKVTLGVVIVFFIPLNMFQSYQTSKNIIHWDRMTTKAYFQVFLQYNYKDKFQENLVSDDEYFRESAERLSGISK